MNPISRLEAIAIHDVSIQRFGGISGIRSIPILESALAAPFHTWKGELFIDTPQEQAAVLLYGIVQNHPFLDGNKRTALLTAAYWLKLNGFRFVPYTDKLLYGLVMEVANGATTTELIYNSFKLLTRRV